MNRSWSHIVVSVCSVLLCLVLAGCGGIGLPGFPTATAPEGDSTTVSGVSQDLGENVELFEPLRGSATVRLKIASGSENKEAAEAIAYAVEQSGVAVEMHYMGSLDIMATLEVQQGTVDAERAVQRGVVDVETLGEVNKRLIDTLRETLKIQQEGRAARADAEVRMRRIEGDLKAALLEAAK